jgi:nitric oxide reductase activation protein
VAQYTRLDLAIDRGAEATGGQNHRLQNRKVIILLTDGLPNQVPPAEDGSVETTVLRAASAAKQAGIIVYTVAIGAPEDTNPKLLIGCASTPDRYYYTPDPEDLEGIYRAIAHSIDCPPGAFWGGR